MRPRENAGAHLTHRDHRGSVGRIRRPCRSLGDPMAVRTPTVTSRLTLETCYPQHSAQRGNRTDLQNTSTDAVPASSATEVPTCSLTAPGS